MSNKFKLKNVKHKIRQKKKRNTFKKNDITSTTTRAHRCL